MNRSLTVITTAALLMVPGLVVRLTHPALDAWAEALLFGLAIVGGAFLLSWAAEVAQLEISQGLALALLALIAILPEYVVDASFAWLAAEDPAYASYAVANMTGANRLLIGIAWPLVLVIAYIRFRKTHISLEKGHGLELVILLAASLYALVLPLKGSISLVDFVVLLALFVYYIYRIARLPAEPPHLVGPAQTVGRLPKRRRRLATAMMALAPAAVILLVAESFAEALVETGVEFGIDEFLLVQWLAPLASEAPEFVVVSLYAWRGLTTPALGALVSSKINQWTLLVAMLPLIYAIALGAPEALQLDDRQKEEVLLTAAQSIFAVALLLDLRLSLYGAAALFGLFVTQLAFPDTRGTITVVYFVLSVLVLFLTRRLVLETIRSVFRR
ncbi:MAG TPA: sodium:calcium antiporter [Thermoleophilia bacterium]|nr:sodium:calcium antiporter [Thermoleophilia bacterium]